MAQRTFTFEDLRRLLVDRGGVPESAVLDDPELSFDEMGLDSLGFIEVQTAVEEDYGIRVGEEDADGITTVGQAIEYMNRRLGAAE